MLQMTRSRTDREGVVLEVKRYDDKVWRRSSVLRKQRSSARPRHFRHTQCSINHGHDHFATWYSENADGKIRLRLPAMFVSSVRFFR